MTLHNDIVPLADNTEYWLVTFQSTPTPVAPAFLLHFWRFTSNSSLQDTTAPPRALATPFLC